MSLASCVANENRHRPSMNLNRKLIAFLILCLLQAGDLLSTRLATSIGAIESNPLVHNLGLGEAKLLALGVSFLLVWRAKRMGRVWAACGIYAATVVSNVLLFVIHG